MYSTTDSTVLLLNFKYLMVFFNKLMTKDKNNELIVIYFKILT